MRETLRKTRRGRRENGDALAKIALSRRGYFVSELYEPRRNDDWEFSKERKGSRGGEFRNK